MPKSDENIFIVNSIFPDSESVFSAQIAPLESTKATCAVVIDTNALLLPYTVSKESLIDIEKRYMLLVSRQQLVIPGQVAREFARNRAQKISELYQQINRKQTSVTSVNSEGSPLLASLPEYVRLVELTTQINALLKEYRKTAGEIKERIQEWNWNDPVSSVYSRLFSTGVVYDPTFDDEFIEKDLTKRQMHQIPPGYKDSAKPDRGIGDLLIWHTILSLGRERKQDVVFVTGDVKSDWFYRSEDRPLYPRYELVDEYRRESSGKTFHAVTFSDFLKLYGASLDVVHDVQREETDLFSATWDSEDLDLISQGGVYALSVDELLQSVAGMCKYSISHNDRSLPISRMAKRIRVPKPLIRLSLEWLSAKGLIKLISWSDDLVTIDKGDDIPNPMEAEALEDLIHTYHSHLRKVDATASKYRIVNVDDMV